MRWTALILLLVHALRVHAGSSWNCTTRPQQPNPYVAGLGGFGGESVRLRLSVTALNPGGAAASVEWTSHCINSTLLYLAAIAATSPIVTQPNIYNEIARYQKASMYGHPRYCQGRRNNIFAQPQYGEAGGSPRAMGINPVWATSAQAYEKNESAYSWSFRGYYFYDVPGRIGDRFGNPGFVSSKDLRSGIVNGQTEYVKNLTNQLQFNTGGDYCPSGNCTVGEEGYRGPGRDIDRSYGVWDECYQGNSRVAYATFVAAGVFQIGSPSCSGGTPMRFQKVGSTITCSCSGFPCPAAGNSTPNDVEPENWNTYRYKNSTCTGSCLLDANCTTCTGKYNYHTRIGVSEVDGGPNDVYADPYNPWDFTITMQYPSYTNASRFNASYNFSQEINATGFCADANLTNCNKLGNALNYMFHNESINSHGYSPSNFGSTNGRWDEVTTRGAHLHSPPENWGASFEPTRALVRIFNVFDVYATTWASVF
jgi:hypothetical protein